MNRTSCAAIVADGYTSASHVASVRNGVIVDERANTGEPMSDILRDMVEVLKVIAKDLEIIEQRVWKLEHE